MVLLKENYQSFKPKFFSPILYYAGEKNKIVN